MDIRLITVLALVVLFVLPVMVGKYARRLTIRAPKRVSRAISLVFMLSLISLLGGTVYLLIQSYVIYQDDLSQAVSVPAWVIMGFFALLAFASLNTFGEALDEYRNPKKK